MTKSRETSPSGSRTWSNLTYLGTTQWNSSEPQFPSGVSIKKMSYRGEWAGGRESKGYE